MKVLTIAVMTEANEARGAEQMGTKFFMGELKDVYCSFTKTSSTFCIRTSSFFGTAEEAQKAEQLGYVVIERGPLVQEDASLKYYSSKGCLSPLNQWSIEAQFKCRIR